MGPYNIQQATAQGVWATYSDEISAWYGTTPRQLPLRDPTQDWGRNAEGPFGRVFAGLYLRSLEAKWTTLLADAHQAGAVLPNPVNALEAALLEYRAKPQSVHRWILVDGVDETEGRVFAGDLAFWRSTGLTR